MDPATHARLVELHLGLERLGPGDAAATRRALAACELPAHPRILDVGCGSGAQTAVLLDATDGHVTAIDAAPAFLAALEDRVPRGRCTPRVADMAALPFPEGSFDLVWSEGAIYIMGFDAGLRAWRPLVAPGGYVAVTELSWLTDAPPADVAALWAQEYPAMRGVAANVRAAEAAGFEVVDTFPLPASAWEAYYGPLLARCAALRGAVDPVMDAVIAVTEREAAAAAAPGGAGGSYSYVFYVLRRLEGR